MRRFIFGVRMYVGNHRPGYDGKLVIPGPNRPLGVHLVVSRLTLQLLGLGVRMALLSSCFSEDDTLSGMCLLSAKTRYYFIRELLVASKFELTQVHEYRGC